MPIAARQMVVRAVRTLSLVAGSRIPRRCARGKRTDEVSRKTIHQLFLRVQAPAQSAVWPGGSSSDPSLRSSSR